MILKQALGKGIKRLAFGLGSVISATIPAERILRAILAPEKAKQELDKNPKSLIRWGDGETNLLVGVGIVFQSANIRLAGSLWKILWSYSSKSNFYLALPNLAFQPIRALLRNGVWKFWWSSRLVLGLFFLLKWQFTKPKFFDAFMFRENGSLDGNDWVPLPISESFPVSRKLVCVSNEKDIDRLADQVNASAVVSIPSSNAYAEINEIEARVRSAIVDLGGEPHEIQVLFAAGPTTKELIMKLSKEYVCYDIGNFKIASRD